MGGFSALWPAVGGAGALLMFLLVATESRDVFEDVADILTAMGWRLGGGDPVDWAAAHSTASVFR